MLIANIIMKRIISMIDFNFIDIRYIIYVVCNLYINHSFAKFKYFNMLIIGETSFSDKLN